MEIGVLLYLSEESYGHFFRSEAGAHEVSIWLSGQVDAGLGTNRMDVVEIARSRCVIPIMRIVWHLLTNSP